MKKKFVALVTAMSLSLGLCASTVSPTGSNLVSASVIDSKSSNQKSSGFKFAQKKVIINAGETKDLTYTYDVTAYTGSISIQSSNQNLVLIRDATTEKCVLYAKPYKSKAEAAAASQSSSMPQSSAMPQSSTMSKGLTMSKSLKSASSSDDIEDNLDEEIGTNTEDEDSSGKDSVDENSSGKDSVGEDSSGKDSVGEDSSGKDSVEINAYSDTCEIYAVYNGNIIDKVTVIIVYSGAYYSESTNSPSSRDYLSKYEDTTVSYSTFNWLSVSEGRKFTVPFIPTEEDGKTMIYILPLEIPIAYVNRQSITGYCSDLGCKVLGTVRNGIVLSITSDCISGYQITVKNASGVTPAYRKVKLIVKPNNNSENLCKGLKLFKPNKNGKLRIKFPRIKNAEKYRLIYKCKASKGEPVAVNLKNLKKHKKSYSYTTKVKYPKKKYYVQIQYLLKNDTKWTKLAKSKTKKF